MRNIGVSIGRGGGRVGVGTKHLGGGASFGALALVPRPAGHITRRLLDRIGHGRLVVTAPGEVRLAAEGAPGEDAALNLHNWRALSRVLAGSDIGFAQAVIDGDCSSPDLVALLRLFDRNISALGTAANVFGPARWLQRLAYLGQANTRRGAARNIMAHYDLGNAFFEAWLDPSMSYSSAIYAEARKRWRQRRRGNMIGSSSY